MNCEEVCDLIGACLDDELSPKETQLIEKHIASCASCKHLKKEMLDLKSRLAHIPRFELPQGLSGRILDRLNEEDGRRTARGRRTRLWLRRVSTHLGAMAAGLLIAVISGQYFADRRLLTDELIASHTRHSLARQTGTVISTDSHTVGPWFTGKVDYAPPAIDLSKKGFPLQAGWIDQLDGRPVAVLTYVRRRHKISLFVLPRNNNLFSHRPDKHKSGFNIADWQIADFHFVAVSDLNLTDLTRFSTAHKAALIKKGNKELM